MEIDAYYHCFKQRKALNFTLENFRKHYPASTIKLVCDGGLDFAEEAKKYNCDYEYKENIKSFDIQRYFIKDNLYQWVERFFEGIKNFKNNFFMLLEDDVLVFKKTNLENLKYEINGCNFDTRFSDKIINNILSYNQKCKNFSWGGCGGSIYRTSFFQNIYKNLDNLKKDTYEYCSLTDHGMWSNDAFLSYLCYRYNGTIGNYDGYCEAWHSNFKQRLINNDIEVLHKFKDLYE